MKRSIDGILTTHAGRLPGPSDVAETVRAIRQDRPHDKETFAMRVQDTTHEVVRKQKEVGLNIVSDGEIGKLGPFYNRLEITDHGSLHPARSQEEGELPGESGSSSQLSMRSTGARVVEAVCSLWCAPGLSGT